MIQAAHVAHFWDQLPERLTDLIEETLAFVKRADPRNRAFHTHDNQQERRFLIGYHLCKNSFLVSRNPTGGIDGMVMWYQFKSPWTWGQIDQWREDDLDGSDIVVSHLVAASQEARERLVDGMRHRIANPEEKTVTALRKNKLVRFDRRNADRFCKLKLN